MEKKIITVYIDNKPYQLAITINKTGQITTYQVLPEKDAGKLDQFIPTDLEFDVNGKIHLDERVKTVKGEQIARIIWNGIKDQLEE
ncbi:hypothetical protein GFS24_25160 [Chitinophaga sp. SYP-B3965]|nr:hypothetical protein [Chitinophaga sp. SYP-B3965]